MPTASGGSKLEAMETFQWVRDGVRRKCVGKSSVGATLLLAFGLGATGLVSCVTYRQAATVSVAAQAAGEFECPSNRVNVIARGDISHGTYDVEACGKRARYVCLKAGGVHCLHQPDPARWDPDPALVASFPKVDTGIGTPDYHLARVCRDPSEWNCNCLSRAGSNWRWNSCRSDMHSEATGL